MTNPDNIVRVRARNGGRASVYEANAWCQNWTTGFVEGSITQNTSADMNILVNGSPSKPAVAIAATPAPYNIALDIVGQKAIAITAPATNSRYSAIVAYTDDLSLATTEDTVTGSPASCGLIVVNGTTSATPVYPTDATIRTAITADGGTGSQAAYVVLAYILVANDTTTITNSLITNTEAVLRNNAVATNSIKDSAVTASKIDFTTLGFVDVALATNTTIVNSHIPSEILELTVTESGKYLAIAIGSSYGQDGILYRYVIGSNGTFDSNDIFMVDSSRHTFAVSKNLNLTVGDKVQLFAAHQSPDGNMRSGSRLFILRIG